MKFLKSGHKDINRRLIMITPTGLALSKNTVDSAKIKNDLTVKPVVKTTYNQNIESFKIYSEDEDNIYVPRYWAKKVLKVEATIVDGLNLQNIEFLGSLRDSQQEVVNQVMPKIQNEGGGVISLPCGFGKTCISIHLFTLLKVKTLVIVHKNFLLNQWIESIKKFSNASIGIIQQNTIDVEGKDIVIAMLQSLSLKEYHHTVFKDFGLLIVDEVHNVATKVFSRALQKVHTKYTIGLSATPDRDDGLSRVFHWYLGDMLYKAEKSKNSSVKVKIVKFLTTKEDEVPKFKELKTRTGDVNLSVMLTNISLIHSRNMVIIEELNKVLMDEPSRNVLILSSRIDQLEQLKTLFDKECTDITSDYYIGKMKPKELKKAEECQVLFATYEMVNEGFDLPKLNTLVFATPRSKIEQAIGRILRTQNSEICPLVIDVIDKLRVFEMQGTKRKKYYKSLNYQITESILN